MNVKSLAQVGFDVAVGPSTEVGSAPGVAAGAIATGVAVLVSDSATAWAVDAVIVALGAIWPPACGSEQASAALNRAIDASKAERTVNRGMRPPYKKCDAIKITFGDLANFCAETACQGLSALLSTEQQSARLRRAGSDELLLDWYRLGLLAADPGKDLFSCLAIEVGGNPACNHRHNDQAD
jgi:hypothetical protein